jgi:hypothetical protein
MSAAAIPHAIVVKSRIDFDGVNSAAFQVLPAGSLAGGAQAGSISRSIRVEPIGLSALSRSI